MVPDLEKKLLVKVFLLVRFADTRDHMLEKNL